MRIHTENAPVDPSKELSIFHLKNIEKVAQFKYLGSMLSDTNSIDADVESRIKKADQIFHSLTRLIWYQDKIKVSIKLKLYKSIIIPILLYGSETWTPLRHHTKRIQVFTNSFIRIITGTSFWEKKRNTQLRTNAKIQRVDVMMQHRRLQWLGHVERMNEERIPRKILVSRIVGRKRSKGGQKKR